MIKRIHTHPGVHVLALAVLLGALGTVVMRGGLLKSALSATETAAPRIIYASIENGKLKVRSSSMDRKDTKILLQSNVGTDAVRARLNSYFNGQASPDGKYIAYKISTKGEEYVYGPSSLYLMEGTGKRKRRLSTYAHYYYWSPDSKQLLYGVVRPTGKEPAEFSMQWNGPEWHLYDVTTAKDRIIAKPADMLNGFDFWGVGNEVIMERSSALGISERYALDTVTGKIRETAEYGSYQNAVARRAGTGTALHLYRLSQGIHSCELLMRTSSGQTTSKAKWSDLSLCYPVAWSGADSFYYTKTTRKDGSATETKVGDTGRYAFGSIYRYDLPAAKSVPILEEYSAGQAYTLLDVIDGKHLLVLHQSEQPGDKLELRDLDGKNAIELYSNRTEVNVVGTLR